MDEITRSIDRAIYNINNESSFLHDARRADFITYRKLLNSASTLQMAATDLLIAAGRLKEKEEQEK